jgi:IS5 family transposase
MYRCHSAAGAKKNAFSALELEQEQQQEEAEKEKRSARREAGKRRGSMPNTKTNTNYRIYWHKPPPLAVSPPST